MPVQADPPSGYEEVFLAIGGRDSRRFFLACLFEALTYPYLDNSLPGHAQTLRFLIE